MQKFQQRRNVVEAVQWFKNGDHPEDDVMRVFEDTGKTPTDPREGKIVRYFRHPNVSGHMCCRGCGRKMRDHGWIDLPDKKLPEPMYIVCPGDYVLKDALGAYFRMNPKRFEMEFEIVGPEISNMELAVRCGAFISLKCIGDRDSGMIEARADFIGPKGFFQILDRSFDQAVLSLEKVIGDETPKEVLETGSPANGG